MPMQTDYSATMSPAVEGALACRRIEAEIDSKYNGDVVNVPFGRAVEWASATEGKAVKLPNAETDKICGFVLRSHSIDPSTRGELDDDAATGGVKPNGVLNVLRKGTIWVKVRTGCAPGDKLWVQTTVAGGGNRVLGGAENADDGSNTVDCTAQGEFQGFAAAGGLAKLRVKF